MCKVLKFGGSSMASAEQMKKVKAIVEADSSRTVVVVSAPGKRDHDDHKITDLLYLCHAHVEYGVNCDNIFSLIRARFCEIRDELGIDLAIEPEFDALRVKLEHGISKDELVSRGEYFAARLAAAFLGYEFLDSADWLFFRLDGTVDREKTDAALRERAADRRVVIPGFYGSMPDGSIHTFSRGGSDITGALAAAALDAEVYENWTDVSGILMADPNIVDDPSPIERVTYAELRELSYAGAKVLHEGTVSPVREKNIPLNIRNTNDPSHPGTLIRESFNEQESGTAQRFITGIAGRKNFSIITVNKTGMSSEAGSLRKVLEIFDRYGVVVEYVPSGIDSCSMVVSAEKSGPAMPLILGEIEKKIQPDEIRLTEHISIVAAVGRKMAFRPGISGKLFAALGENGINIRMISQGPEELNIIVGVDDQDFAAAIRVLYNSFVK